MRSNIITFQTEMLLSEYTIVMDRRLANTRSGYGKTLENKPAVPALSIHIKMDMTLKNEVERLCDL